MQDGWIWAQIRNHAEVAMQDLSYIVKYALSHSRADLVVKADAVIENMERCKELLLSEQGNGIQDKAESQDPSLS